MTATTANTTEQPKPRTKPSICAKDVRVAYQSVVALFDVELDIFPGEMVAICGPNGSGKTTLLKTMLGVVKPYHGRVKVLGELVDKDNSLNKETKIKVGYVPQATSVDHHFPALVKDVVMMGRYAQVGLFKRPKEEDWNLVYQALQDIGMEAFLDRPIGHLSGGQLQKVMIARSLAQNPEILLLDEPTSALDVKTARDLMKLVQDVQKKRNLTIVMVNHDISLIKSYFPRVICVMNKVAWDGSPQDPEFDQVLQRVFYHALPAQESSH